MIFVGESKKKRCLEGDLISTSERRKLGQRGKKNYKKKRRSGKGNPFPREGKEKKKGFPIVKHRGEGFKWEKMGLLLQTDRGGGTHSVGRQLPASQSGFTNLGQGGGSLVVKERISHEGKKKTNCLVDGPCPKIVEGEKGFVPKQGEGGTNHPKEEGYFKGQKKSFVGEGRKRS